MPTPIKPAMPHAGDNNQRVASECHDHLVSSTTVSAAPGHTGVLEDSIRRTSFEESLRSSSSPAEPVLGKFRRLASRARSFVVVNPPTKPVIAFAEQLEQEGLDEDERDDLHEKLRDMQAKIASARQRANRNWGQKESNITD
eukprot:CAMPEP_0183343586 /NCGR_PEP_ID=MMETSP0164_2-20130417/9469_1 /TAXON_ID=221442 /ORGANISM="Coccolithus pelagicus ssp braarudi, Strain PLY182g" /LENGTH=141 /DNA_ID=CAMNT_0025514441 /DNA_START=85 /DNA_END=510 /DNA_ORIENTATION=+